MQTIIGYIDYVSGHLRYGHYELELNDEDFEKFKVMSQEEQKEEIQDNGILVIDDYEIDDIGTIYSIEIEEDEV